ncbi:hypothetical protein KJY78_03785 [Canibacter sp. lx-45]|uniref:sterol carrier family protein n=1 Tax=Canibacter zhuwentaonis TaxID=2837491 RepID=UPI001BDC95F5|nr:sterol carrier family protein [Canibacter zhuwentaonis]MBT1035472.1 hypothetical protein [Canibacter zhuwentaonis]
MARRKISETGGFAALRAFLQNSGISPQTLATAVRFSLQELSAIAPGEAVEVRVPPYGATQCLQGGQHRRGTPPNVVETDALTWLALSCGKTTWERAVRDGKILASGSKAEDLATVLPVFSTSFCARLSAE